MIEELKNKKILILGFGREGQSTYLYLQRLFPKKTIGIADKRKISEWDQSARRLIEHDSLVKVNTGSAYLDNLNSFNLIFKTPGIPYNLPEIKKAKKDGVVFTSQTKHFFELCRGKIIGVTGTKGKSTTSALIFHILKKAGVGATLIGNIGKPPLDYLTTWDIKTWYVFELSSHQLSDIQISPHIAVLLNIFKEHLDYYANFKEYLSAKENITRFQSQQNFFIYNKDIPEFSDIVQSSKARKLAFSFNFDTDVNCFVKNGFVCLNENGETEKVVKVNKIALRGDHNLANVMAAILASKSAGVSNDKIKSGILSFKPLKYRIQNIGIYGGVEYISDTLATIPEATIASIKALNGKVDTLICGGYDRGQDFSKLAQEIVNSNISNLVLFPETGLRIWEEIQNSSSKLTKKINHIFVDNMKEAVSFSFENTKVGKVCLLSPASPSFTLFKSYEDESDQFEKYIKNNR